MKISHQVCSLSGYILSEEIKPTFFLCDERMVLVLTIMDLFWRHYGVEGGLGDEQDP